MADTADLRTAEQWQAHYAAARHRMGMTAPEQPVVKRVRNVARPVVRDYLDVASPRFRTDVFISSRRAILDAVVAESRFPETQITGQRRARFLAEWRHVYYWLCLLYTTSSYPQIGRMCGGRDHSTVMSGVRRVRRCPERFEARIAAVKARLGIADGHAGYRTCEAAGRPVQHTTFNATQEDCIHD